MKVMIFDYGAGDLHSLAKAVERDRTTVEIQSDPHRAADADVLVLPGVGAFGSSTERLAPGRDTMRRAILGGLPTIGICLGMQLLFDGSEEGPGAGLGIVQGQVTRLRAARVPQIGWNSIEPVAAEPLFASAPLPMAYFANSYVCRPDDARTVIAWSEHDGDRFASAVRVGSAVGVQFHPEKSSADGVRFLHAFLDEAAALAGTR